ncbi:MAG: Fe-S cluster assembly protein IscX [Lautropia sp.]
MIWTDVQAIAEALQEAHPDVDPRTVRFTDLNRWVMALPGFDGEAGRGGERVLEAIQQAWIEEAD